MLVGREVFNQENLIWEKLVIIWVLRCIGFLEIQQLHKLLWIK